MNTLTMGEFLALPQVAFVAAGTDDGQHDRTYVYVNQPSEEVLRDHRRWTTEADYCVPYYASQNTLEKYYLEYQRQETVQDRWPGVTFVDYHCLCCCGSEDLVAVNTCSSCEVVFGHIDDCLWAIPWSPEQQQRYEVFHRGELQGESGRRCTQRTLDGRRGYRAGRRQRKARRLRR